MQWAGFSAHLQVSAHTHQSAGRNRNWTHQHRQSEATINAFRICVEWMLFFSLFHCSRYGATFLHVREPVAAGPLIKTHP